mmetsp:Transcript_4746/g.11589  ORF Transcript_4746/g.11589 Transcript_4746/m.11589 type:complete len:234 (-) Transcript_4746:1408-2109(-)
MSSPTSTSKAWPWATPPGPPRTRRQAPSWEQAPGSCTPGRSPRPGPTTWPPPRRPCSLRICSRAAGMLLAPARRPQAPFSRLPCRPTSPKPTGTGSPSATVTRSGTTPWRTPDQLLPTDSPTSPGPRTQVTTSPTLSSGCCRSGPGTTASASAPLGAPGRTASARAGRRPRTLGCVCRRGCVGMLARPTPRPTPPGPRPTSPAPRRPTAPPPAPPAASPSPTPGAPPWRPTPP